jgi:transcriptional regulator GlxA family with amidase domain
VRNAVAQIEMRLHESLSVSEIARSAGVSYGYLSRLFQAAYGVTVVAYLRERRMKRARHLLLDSDLPIKAIAGSVGIADLHLFNKTIRRTFGCSPRQVRTAPRQAAVQP